MKSQSEWEQIASEYKKEIRALWADIERARGYGTTGFSSTSSSRFIVFASENWTDTAQGSDIALTTTLNGNAASTSTERARLTNYGSFGIGTSSPAYALDVVGGAKASLGFYIQSQTVTSNTTIAIGQINTVVNSSTPVTVYLPQASTLLTTVSGATYTQSYTISNWNTGSVTIAAYSGDTILGATSSTLNFQYSSVTLIPSSLGWSIT